jgi:hypothetical protein
MEFSRLAECSFPELTKLKLPLQSGAVQAIDSSRCRFIEEHPTIEDLFWHPIGVVSLSPQSLPVLKRLSTSHQLLGILEDVAYPRFIECLDVQSLGSHMFPNLKNLDRGRLRKLKLHSFGDLASIYQLAELFPALTWLSMPKYRTPPHAIGPISLGLVCVLFEPLLSLPLMNCQRRTGLTYFPAFLSLKSIEVQVYGRQSTWTRIKCTTQFWSLYNCVPNCANWIIVNSTISVITGSELSS